MPRLKIGTRGSPLALAQAHETRARLIAAHGFAEGDIEIAVAVVVPGQVSVLREGDRFHAPSDPVMDADEPVHAGVDRQRASGRTHSRQSLAWSLGH